MIYTLVGLLVMFWVLGLVARVGGEAVHFLLVCAVLLAVFNFFTGRRVGV